MSKGTLDIILITFFCGIIIRFKLDWYVEPTLKHNILSKGKLDYSTRSARKFWEGKIVVNLNGTQVFSFGKPSSPLSFPSTWRGQHRVARARGVACPKGQCWGLYCVYCTRPRLATLSEVMAYHVISTLMTPSFTAHSSFMIKRLQCKQLSLV